LQQESPIHDRFNPPGQAATPQRPELTGATHHLWRLRTRAARVLSASLDFGNQISQQQVKPMLTARCVSAGAL